MDGPISLFVVGFHLLLFQSPISKRTLSLVFFSTHDVLCIFLHIHISHALIAFQISLSLSPSHSHTKLSGKSVTSRSFFGSMLTCLSRHNFSSPIIVAFPIATLRFISLSHPGAAPQQGVLRHFPWQKCLRPGCRPGCRPG